MESGTIASVNPNEEPILVLEKDDKQLTTGTYISRGYMC